MPIRLESRAKRLRLLLRYRMGFAEIFLPKRATRIAAIYKRWSVRLADLSQRQCHSSQGGISTVLAGWSHATHSPPPDWNPSSIRSQFEQYSSGRHCTSTWQHKLPGRIEQIGTGRTLLRQNRSMSTWEEVRPATRIRSCWHSNLEAPSWETETINFTSRQSPPAADWWGRKPEPIRRHSPRIHIDIPSLRRHN